MAKQLDIPGTKQELVPEIGAAADYYVEKRDGRMRATEREVEARTELVEQMVRHGRTTYQMTDGSTVVLVTDTKVKVKRAKEDGELLEREQSLDRE